MNALEDIRDMLYDELDCVASEGQLTKGNLDIVDKLTHALKSIETIIAMNDYDGNSYRNGTNMRYENGGSYSRGNMRYAGRGSRNSYRNNGGSYNNGSYRGRYSREESKEKMIEKLQEYMEETDSDRIRESINKVISQIESEN